MLVKYLPLIWSGVWRKPVRTALIFLQVFVGFALFGILQGMKSGMDKAIAGVRADVLYVGPAVMGGARLPIAGLSRLQSVPGVKTVSSLASPAATDRSGCGGGISRYALLTVSFPERHSAFAALCRHSLNWRL
jgi:hypothetical protein